MWNNFGVKLILNAFRQDGHWAARDFQLLVEVTRKVETSASDIDDICWLTTYFNLFKVAILMNFSAKKKARHDFIFLQQLVTM